MTHKNSIEITVTFKHKFDRINIKLTLNDPFSGFLSILIIVLATHLS
jgi:hypothetical protein